MLEDCSVMEKKPNGRSTQPLLKAGGTENKKSLDANVKPFGKYSRRRESTGYNNPKNEPPRKFNAYKGGKFPDKKPKPRNQYYGCGKEDTKVVDEDGPEFGSVFVPGSKKQNLNHLLNFHYAPLSTSASNGSRIRSAPQNWFSTQKHKYNKEHFLQANCQFVVKENADYSAHFVDPDLLVDWNQIEQIKLQTGALVTCPICLDTPVAGKITRCGHVFCWSCILHYLALSDKTWRKCPICFEAVHKNDLKSVVTLAYAPYKVNEEITFKLMKRERGCLLPVPVEECSKKTITGLLSMRETEIDTVYSKLLLAKPEDVMSIINWERNELKDQAKENAGCPEICFIEQAIELLNEREEQVKKTIEEVDRTPVCLKKEADGAENDLIEEFNANLLLEEENFGRTRNESMSSEGGTTSEEDHLNIAPEDLEMSCCNTSTKPFYFYQASDGQHVYLHAINIRMLEMQYGSLEKCPRQITGKIIEKEVGSMTESLRKRLRYLQHLPLTCQFEVAEINLSAYISDEVLSNFKDQIEARIKRRHRRAREERRREKKINEEVNLKWGRRPTPKIRIESHRQFPLCGSSSDEVLTALPPSPSESNTVSRSQSLNSLSSVSTTLENNLLLEFTPVDQFVASTSLDCPGPSFAQMLKEGKSQGPKRKSWASSSPKVEASPSSQTVDSEGELEGYVPVPRFSQSFSDAFAVALEKAELEQDDTSCKKKKKKKQKVLFVTGMACSAK